MNKIKFKKSDEKWDFQVLKFWGKTFEYGWGRKAWWRHDDGVYWSGNEIVSGKEILEKKKKWNNK